MRGDPKYRKLEDFDSEDGDISHHPEEKASVLNLLIAFFLLTSAVLCFIFVTSTQSQPTFIGKVRGVIAKQKPPAVRRNWTKFEDLYFTREETEMLNCSTFFNGDADLIDAYVNNGRLRLNKERLIKLDMDCDSIRYRVMGDIKTFVPLNRPIAFVRNIYNLYELQEAFLSMSYHPDNVFCYVMDSKSDDRFKNDMRTMSSCFHNIFVLDEEFNFDSLGHGQDRAHYDCLLRIMDKPWEHAILLQNPDLVIKTSEQLSNLSETLGTISIMGFDRGFTYRYETKADWTPAGMKLFKNETGVPAEILHRPLQVKKSLNEVILSKLFVKSLSEKLNMDIILNLFDNNTYYGVDEMMFQTLYENYLGLEGQMESNCSRNHNDVLSRLTHWDWSGPNGYDKDCKSKFKRHGICILGVEYLRELQKSNLVLANKVVSRFDFGTIICAREMLRNNTAGSVMSKEALVSFPQFREMQMKINGTYNRETFDC